MTDGADDDDTYIDSLNSLENYFTMHTYRHFSFASFPLEHWMNSKKLCSKWNRTKKRFKKLHNLVWWKCATDHHIDIYICDIRSGISCFCVISIIQFTSTRESKSNGMRMILRLATKTLRKFCRKWMHFLLHQNPKLIMFCTFSCSGFDFIVKMNCWAHAHTWKSFLWYIWYESCLRLKLRFPETWKSLSNVALSSKK